MIKALEDSDRDARFVVARVLGLLGDASAVAPLLAALDDEERIVRAAAERALTDLSSHTLVVLSARVTDPDPKVRSKTLETWLALRTLRSPFPPAALAGAVSALGETLPKGEARARIWTIS